MKNMTLTAIAQACGGQLFEYCDRSGMDSAGMEIAGVALDSRKVEKDYLFIATVGDRVDGHDFIDDVFEKGAMAVVCEKAPVNCRGPYVLVQNSFVALKDIAKWYRMQLNVKVVGITGSVGKTSTKEFISSVVAQKYNVLATEGNFNNEVGLPLTILKIRDTHEVAVLEMGISDFGEMHRLSEIAKPDICVITNIGECHLENLKTRQGVLNAKIEIFDFMSESGKVCINGDDDMLATLGEIKGNKPIKFGMNASNDVFATNVILNGLLGSTCDLHVKGTLNKILHSNININDNTFHTNGIQSHTKDRIVNTKYSQFHTKDRSFQANIPLPGEHMILNAMAATTVATLLDMTCDEIVVGIKSIQPVGGRSNIIRQEKWTIIDDCYNANPISMKAAIDLLSMSDGKKIAILGDMLELGDNEMALHKEVGVYAAHANVDILVCVGKLSSNMFEGAAAIFKANVLDNVLENVPDNVPNNVPNNISKHKLLYYETTDELIEALPTIVKEDHTILVKASHGMGFEKVVKALL